MTDALLFLHVLAAFFLVITVVMHSAFALGAPAGPGAVFAANRLWDLGGLGTIVLGVWLALRIDGYELTDGWILGALVMWFVIAFLGFRVNEALVAAPASEAGASATAQPAPSMAALHWLRALVVLLLLVDMILKPWA